jgi:hypothetical protein
VTRFRKGKLPNKRGGFFHNHSGEHECGIAYIEDGDERDGTPSRWLPCRKLANHEGRCGYADNTAY